MFRNPLIAVALTFIPVAFAAPADTAAHKSVWSGVYTAAQAARGDVAYDKSCSLSCHQPRLNGYGGVLIGASFTEHWREDNLGNYFDRIKGTMPRGAPGSLSDPTYVDIIAFILKSNGFPAGNSELTPAVLTKIQIEDKDGPKPVPEFALVKTTGCLEKGSDGVWLLDHAKTASRTRNPEAATGAELKAETGGQGTAVFHFLNLMPYDVTSFKLEMQKGHVVEAKGFLMKKPEGEVLNLTSVTTVAPSCKP